MNKTFMVEKKSIDLSKVKKYRKRRITQYQELTTYVKEPNKNPLEVNILEEIDELSDSRPFVVNDVDITTGVEIIKILSKIRQKQDDYIINEIDGFPYEEIVKEYERIKLLVSSRKSLKKLALLLEEKYHYNSQITDLPVGLTNEDIHKLIDIDKIIIKTKQLLRNKPSFSPRKDEESNVLVFPEDKNPEFNKNLRKLLREISPEQHYSLLKFITADSFQESVFRLQCIGYFVSTGQIKLSVTTDEEKEEKGKLTFQLVKDNYEKDNPSMNKSLVFGLSKRNWKHLYNYYITKKEKKRKKIPYFD